MPGPSSTVIVTSEGLLNDRSALATVRAIARAGRRAIVATSGPNSIAAASRFTTEHVSVEPTGHPHYASTIQQVARERGASTVFATSDGALSALYPATDRLMDKATLRLDAATAGLDTPGSYEVTDSNNLDDSLIPFGFPMIVKPRKKRPGGPNVVRVDELFQLRSAVVEAGDGALIQPFLDGTTRAVAGVTWDGKLVAVLQQRYLRTFPPGAGTACAAITESVDSNWSAALAKLLTTTNGIFQAQFVGSNLIDLNLRPYGSMPLALAAGLNLPDLVCRLGAGDATPYREANLGVRYRWLDGDVRTLVSDVRNGRQGLATALWELAPRRGTAHSIMAIRDPKPGLVRLRRRRPS